MDLRGRVAVVTGGAGRIGEAFCEAFAELGCAVAILDIAREAAEQRADEITSRFGARCTSVAVDLTREQDVAGAVGQVMAENGRIDILVNNAAYPPLALVPDGLGAREQTLEQWDANLALMLRGTFMTTRACAPHLAATGNGAVVNVASIYGLVGPDLGLYEGTEMTNPAWYAAGKGGIVQLTRYWATTLAPAVRVNCIAPGGVWRKQPERFHDRYKSRTPLRRMATEEDLKGALAYLGSDLSAYVSGQVLAVDGGWTAW